MARYWKDMIEQVVAGAAPAEVVAEGERSRFGGERGRFGLEWPTRKAKNATLPAIEGFRKLASRHQQMDGSSTVTDKPRLRLVKTHTGEKGHTAKVYKDSDWGEHRVKFYNPDGSSHGKDSDYHTDDLDDAHDTAKHFLKRMG